MRWSHGLVRPAVEHSRPVKGRFGLDLHLLLAHLSMPSSTNPSKGPVLDTPCSSSAFETFGGVLRFFDVSFDAGFFGRVGASGDFGWGVCGGVTSMLRHWILYAPAHWPFDVYRYRFVKASAREQTRRRHALSIRGMPRRAGRAGEDDFSVVGAEPPAAAAPTHAGSSDDLADLDFDCSDDERAFPSAPTPRCTTPSVEPPLDPTFKIEGIPFVCAESNWDVFHKVCLVDRRAKPAQPTHWVFLYEMEGVLYGNETTTTGAVTRLLGRTEGAKGRAMMLTSTASIAGGLVNSKEWDALCDVLHASARRLTLIPVATLAAAMHVYGDRPISRALLAALQLPCPWDGSTSSGEGDADAGHDDRDDGDGTNGGGSDAGGRNEDHGSAEQHDTTSTNPTPDEPQQDSGGEGRHASATITAQLKMFRSYRLTVLNKHRAVGSCQLVTVENDEGSVLRFLSWLKSAKNLTASSLFAVFRSPQLGSLVETYVQHLIGSGRRFSTAASYLSGLVNVSRFVVALCRSKGVPIDTAQLDQLTALHRQCQQRARREGKFDGCTASKLNWLDWASVQRARVHANNAYDECDDDEEGKLARARDALVMTLLTHQPPDRVGVARKLQLGGTLKWTFDGYVLDLSQPDAHKTAGVFGPSKTTMSDAITRRIDAYLDLHKPGLQAGDYLFHQARHRSRPLSSSQWTRLVKACFQTHANVPFAPKDLRASFVTFLRSNNHSDDTLRAAAHAMRHSSRTQESAAYNKGHSDRLVAAAVRAAEAYAATFD